MTFGLNKRRPRQILSRSLRWRLTRDPFFMSGIVTSDESWVNAYGPMTSRHNGRGLHLHGRRRHMAEPHSSCMSFIYLLIFWHLRDCASRIHPHTQCQTINRVFYCNVLKHLWENIQRMWPNAKNWTLIDNLFWHRALLVHEFRTRNNILSLLYPTSPDSSRLPCFPPRWKHGSKVAVLIPLTC